MARTPHAIGVTCHCVFVALQIVTAMRPKSSKALAATFSRKFSKPMLGHLAIERRAAEPELLRGPAQVAGVLRDGLANRGLLECFQVQLQRVLRGCRGASRNEQILETERRILRHDHGPLDCM